jgi:hypothetical protein
VLDFNEVLTQTSILNGNFNGAEFGQDNKLYITGGGVVRLNDDGSFTRFIPPLYSFLGGTIRSVVKGYDNKLYFFVQDGIVRLEDDGTFVLFSSESGFYSALGQDRKIYFSVISAISSVFVLNEDLTVSPLNDVSFGFVSAKIGQDGKLYFCSGGAGVYVLD